MGPDEARRCLDLGASLSFSGVVTFKTAQDVREAAALCPPDRLLVETDSPFLTPVPHRGSPNEPARVPLVGATIAQVTGRDTAEVAAPDHGQRPPRLRSLRAPGTPGGPEAVSASACRRAQPVTVVTSWGKGAACPGAGGSPDTLSRDVPAWSGT